MHWYKMVTGIDLMRYQTKYRPNDHQKLPFKKPLVETFAVILIRCSKLNTLRSYYADLSIHSTMLLIISSDRIETIHG